MVYNPILNTEIQVGDPITQSLMQKIKDNDDFFNGMLGQFNTLDIVNGSFEQDSDSDGTPDNWTWTAHPGGSKSIIAGIEGTNQFRVTVPTGVTNGGGTLDSDYYPVPQFTADSYRVLSWILMCSMTTVGVKVTIRAYNGSKTYISSYDIFSATSGLPNSWQRYWAVLRSGSLPSNCRYIRVRLESGTIGPGVAATVDWDSVTLKTALPPCWLYPITYSTSPATTTSSTYSTLATFTIGGGPDYPVIGGEASLLVEGYIQLKVADPNIGAFAQVTHTGSSTTSNEIRAYKLQPAGTGDSEQIWHFAVRVAATYAQTYTLNVQAKNDDNTTTVTITQPGWAFAKVTPLVDWS